MSADDASATNSSGAGLLAAGALGALVALSLGIYGSVHDPASDLSVTLGFKDTITMKVWLASLAALLAVAQVTTAAWMFGKLPLSAPPHWIGSFHRISGGWRSSSRCRSPTTACTSWPSRTRPRACSCTRSSDARSTEPSRRRSSSSAPTRCPGFALPLAGGVLFSLLVGVWLTSGLWFINENGFPSP